jgi:very-short-patch-repair endonuclease
MATKKHFRELSPTTVSRSRKLRREMTKVEGRLWWFLRMKQYKYKFRRQHPIGPYIVDFVCIDKKLIVELDGSQHAEQQTYDQHRDAFLQSNGYRVLRFWNNAVTENIEGVIEEILKALQDPHRLASG